jgi:hypothetical protein
MVERRSSAIALFAQIEPPEPSADWRSLMTSFAALAGEIARRVTVTIKDHFWMTRIAMMRGRCPFERSKANLQVALERCADMESRLSTEAA